LLYPGQSGPLIRCGQDLVALLLGAALSEGVDLLTERQVEQPEPPADPELVALLPF